MNGVLIGDRAEQRLREEHGQRQEAVEDAWSGEFRLAFDGHWQMGGRISNSDRDLWTPESGEQHKLRHL